ncbi:uncharacterized protein Pyn_34219 [Prunus yedoensis var. nudiflora]|uniref:Uncharacterized protein n=1 Tax=Prunus yedoensis var. nudiflora TaxID=2094558 RepID=A0A314V3X2_PRUYE|nr:uncharacterized protein Pyn_34219 [Prunus yedoensis var. nudiflora]
MKGISPRKSRFSPLSHNTTRAHTNGTPAAKHLRQQTSSQRKICKDDDFGETHRPACSNHEDDEDDEVVVKEEEIWLIPQISLLISVEWNSFKCSYPIQSWI